MRRHYELRIGCENCRIGGRPLVLSDHAPHRPVRKDPADDYLNGLRFFAYLLLRISPMAQILLSLAISVQKLNIRIIVVQLETWFGILRFTNRLCYRSTA